ncbi:MAG: ribonuclease HII [Bacteroidetes bacterium]|jgi:ribonuclease HII|nr:ribonuclease HII [Bacteroidota bacterium]MBK9525858.1 ribonuclease HII [Bacteroidota bacterium]MBK9543224.1 ribonuclease HII [Bacteroidota bacterium]MBP6402167.1 ribonuclease HII [Bacteroidia bacterium]MBP6648727.1 ribonuclease HII [Bacteroidia bacterium]
MKQPKLFSYFQTNLREAGCDEAGRGCLAGAVFAAAVILPGDFFHPDLNDSKQINETKRNLLRPIIEKEAIAWSVASVSAEEIDTINILNASFLAMHRALDQLKKKPRLLLIDGNRFHRYKNIPHKCIIGGDGLYTSIAAASVLAKTYRDDYMEKMHLEFPQFGWDRNKGYGTALHRKALLEYGPSPIHRRSFRLHKEEAELPFNSTL